VAVWATAAQLDFSFAAAGAGEGGAPAAWDDAAGADYHTPVAGAPSGARLAALVLSALAAAGAGEEAAAADAARRRALRKAELKAAAAAARARALRSRLFTDPSAPRAGAPVTVYYNPDRTVLRGRPDVYARGGFDRRAGGGAACFLPAKMAPAVPEAGGLGWLAATLDLPADASVLDLTFLDAPDAHGGFADANGGRGYVLEVVGGRGAPPAPLRVAHVAAEMAPIAKAGGLGDVVTALGRAVQEEGHAVEIVLPKYDCLNYALVEGLVLVGDFFVGNVQVKAWRGRVEGLVTTFLEPTDGSVWVGAIYTEMGRDRGRFGLFCAAALEWLTRHAPEGRPDVVHAHDWQSAPVLAGARAAGAAAAFTIHNLNYGADLIGLGMAEADVATTVSPTYASEVAGHPSVAPHLEKFVGVRNGIDFDAWDPETDAALPRNYAVADAAAGKAAAKAELRARLGLAEGAVPLVAVVTRLTHQKGVHLIKHAAWRAAERGAQFVLLGSAPDPKVQAEFEALAEDLRRAYPDRARLWFAYDEPLSHLIYAAADLLLVPSIFEPCGLTQMIAMRYGAVPVVRRTGGLADTVFDLDDDAARAAAAGLPMNGFSFDGADAAGLDYALNRALDAWYDRPLWEGLVERVMSLDWSWAGPAREYVDLYYRAVQRAG
jgi:starch synthase